MSVRRIFVEKKPDYAVKAGELREELVSYLGITGVKSVRVLILKIFQKIPIRKHWEPFSQSRL